MFYRHFQQDQGNLLLLIVTSLIRWQFVLLVSVIRIMPRLGITPTMHPLWHLGHINAVQVFFDIRKYVEFCFDNAASRGSPVVSHRDATVYFCLVIFGNIFS